jgi:hypothetical protein
MTEDLVFDPVMLARYPAQSNRANLQSCKSPNPVNLLPQIRHPTVPHRHPTGIRSIRVIRGPFRLLVFNV